MMQRHRRNPYRTVAILSLGCAIAAVFDSQIAEWVRQHPLPREWRTLMGVVRWPGHFAFTLAVAGIVYLMRRPLLDVSALLVGGISTGVATVLIKWIAARSRPFRSSGWSDSAWFAGGISGLFSPPPNLSLPSGDVSLAAVTATVISSIFPEVRLPAWGWTMLVAFARVRVGAHFPSDVAVGIALGWLIGKATLRVARARFGTELRGVL